MLRFFNWRWLMVWLGLAGGVQQSPAFSLLGPKEAYQIDNLGYWRSWEIEYPGVIWYITASPEFTFAPHNLGEEFRWSVPVLYYSYDASFADPDSGFGSNAIYAVDSAFNILNGAFSTNPVTGQYLANGVDSYTPEISEFPMDELRYNYTAQALHLFDLKSAALEMLVARLGLADPDRFTWTIRSRDGTPCPFYTYIIIQRNFDPVTFEPSKYVNGNLFTYAIEQYCPPDIHGDRADAVEFKIDPLATYQTAVASAKITFPTIQYYGMYHTSLTRDDVGGLRYLYRTNNANIEMAPPDSILFQTNYSTPQLLYSSNLAALASAALTNDANALASLFPGLIISSTTSIFTNVVTTNYFAYFTNVPTLPAGTLKLVVVTNLTTNVATWYRHTFENVLTNTYSTNGIIILEETGFGSGPFFCGPYAPPDLFCPLNRRTVISSNALAGDFFLLPTNSLCGLSVVRTQLVTVQTLTNASFTATNTPDASNTNGQSYTQNVISFFTNTVLVINPVDCVADSVALRQGLERMTFIRHDYDSLLNRFFYPVTNIYTRIAITNNQPFLQRFRRIVTRPDVVIAAQDITGGPDIETVDHFGSAPRFNGSNSIPGLAGPGTIEGPITLTFNKGGQGHLSFSPFFLTEANSITYFNWASFDGSTNTPVIYPSNASMTNLENQILIRISPSSLPAAQQGAGYSVNLSVTGGQQPYSWSMSPTSPGLPAGLALTQDPGDSSRATISGIPETEGTFDFWIRLTDAGSRFVDYFYVLRIDP